MNPKSFLAIQLALASAIVLLLAPTVESCVNFQSWWQAPSGPDAYLLNAQLWDDSSNTVCSADKVYVNSDGPDPYLTLTCDAGYSAVFDTINNYDLTYSSPNPGGPWVLNAEWDDANQIWYLCAFCGSPSDCFVPTDPPHCC